jgi:hypothetical protein
LKKLFSSIFVILILLNVMGYYGIFLGMQYKNAQELIQQFDANTYNHNQAETLKIPFKSPDTFDSETFERIDGDFERDGEVYRIIKQRQFRDTFHIVYIKDKTGTDLNKALADYVKTFSDESSDDGNNTSVVPSFIKEYFSKTLSMQPLSPGWEQSVRQESHSNIFIEAFTASIIHPPERA